MSFGEERDDWDSEEDVISHHSSSTYDYKKNRSTTITNSKTTVDIASDLSHSFDDEDDILFSAIPAIVTPPVAVASPGIVAPVVDIAKKTSSRAPRQT